MATINLNNYMDIYPKDMLNFLDRVHPDYSIKYIYDNLNDKLFDWVIEYLDDQCTDYEDLDWGDGISDLCGELDDYIYDNYLEKNDN